MQGKQFLEANVDIWNRQKQTRPTPRESRPYFDKNVFIFFFFIAYPAFNQYIKSVSVAHTNVCVFKKYTPREEPE